MKTTIFSLAALSLMAVLMVGAGQAMSDAGWQTGESDDDGDRWERITRRSTGVAPAANPAYQEECGSCHMAYPPGLLPADSWRAVMAGLEDHFGDNAELDAETRQQLTAWLAANAADTSDYRHSRRLLAGFQATPDQPVLRITETAYFRRQHAEVPAQVVARSGAASLSHCNACHQRAQEGSFNEHEIRISGIGRWDD